MGIFTHPVFLYLVFSSAWIIFSDRVVAALFERSDLLVLVQSAKGLLFVLGSALFVLWVMHERRDAGPALEAERLAGRRFTIVGAVLAGLTAFAVCATAIVQADMVRKGRAREAVLGVAAAHAHAFSNRLAQALAAGYSAQAVSSDGVPRLRLPPGFQQAFSEVRSVFVIPHGRVSNTVFAEGLRADSDGRLLRDPALWTRAEQIRLRPKPGLVGPLHLSGAADPLLVVLLPIVAGDSSEDVRALVGVSVDSGRLLRESGLAEFERDYAWQLSYPLTEGGTAVAFRSQAPLAGTPVEMSVPVPGGHWNLEVTPNGGWPLSSQSLFEWGLAVLASTLAAMMAHAVLRMPSLLRQQVELQTGELSGANDRLRVEVDERQHMELALRGVAESVCAPVGPSYFSLLARELARIIGAECVLIGTHVEANPALAQAIGVFGPCNLSEGALYEIGEGPCPRIEADGQCPRAVALRLSCTRDVEARVQVPILGPGGTPIGDVTAFWCAPLPRGLQAEALMRIIAARVASELDSRRAETALRLERDFNLAVVDTVGALVVVLDRDGCIVRFNPTCEALTGYDAAELQGRAYWEVLVPEEERETVRERFGRLLAGQFPASDESHWLTREGRSRLIEWRNSAILNGRGGVDYVIGTGIDVTERRLAEEKFTKAFHAVPEPMLVARLSDGCILAVNEGFERASGFSAGEVIGHTSTGLGLWVNPEANDHLMQRLLQGERIREAEADFRTKSGELRYGVMSAEAFELGDTPCLVSVVRDVTEAKRAEQERLKLEARLRQAQKMESVGQLAGGIAHDFNNTLAAMLGFTELAQTQVSQGTTGRLAGYLSEVHTAGERARDLVSQLLAFSRGTEVAAERVVVRPIVNEAVNMLRSTLPATVSITLHLDQRLPDILISPVQLHQVVMNLCVNARDAMSGRGRIDIRVCRARMPRRSTCSSCHSEFSGEWLMIAVADDGEGIPADIRDKIFDPFFTTKEVGKGTGLGLSVVHGIVHSNGGHVQVDSRPDRGTEVRFYLPALAPPVLTERHGAPEVAALSTPGRILVIDDEPAITSYISELLENQGCTVVACTDPLEALQRFDESPWDFDVVITDQTMPNLTGEELTVKMRTLRPDLPVILCTGFSHTMDDGKAAELGIAHFLLKPVSAGRMLRAVAACLEKDGEEA